MPFLVMSDIDKPSNRQHFQRQPANYQPTHRGSVVRGSGWRSCTVEVQRQQAIAFCLDHAIAFSAELFQSRPVKNRNLSPAVLDHAELLQLAGGVCDAFAPHAEHVSDQFLGHCQFVC